MYFCISILLWISNTSLAWSPIITIGKSLNNQKSNTPLAAVIVEPEVDETTTTTTETTNTETLMNEKIEDAASASAATSSTTSSPLPPRALAVSSEILLPFPVEVAYDAFAELSRQPEWSPWLYSVETIDNYNSMNDDDDDGTAGGEAAATKWTLKVVGVSYSWISVATNTDRPYKIQWESISGLKNFGQVQFEPLLDSERGGRNQGEEMMMTAMTMTMTFVPPRLVSALYRNSRGVKIFMERKLLGSSLRMFRDIIAEEYNTNVSLGGDDDDDDDDGDDDGGGGKNSTTVMPFLPI